MKHLLRETTLPVSNAAIYRWAGGVACAGAIVALALATLLRPVSTTIIAYALVPLVVAIFAWVIAGLARLCFLGIASRQADYSIPLALKPWIRFWLLARFGLFGSLLLLLVGVLATEVAGVPIYYCIAAFVFVTLVRILMDLTFGAVLNIGLITRRHSAG